MTTTLEKIRAIIVRDFELPAERLQRDTLLEEIELDSLSITELVFSIEDEFQITAENSIPPFKTLGDMADYVARLIAERDTKPRAAAKSAASPTTPKAAAPAPIPKPTAARAKKARPVRNGAPEPGKRFDGARQARAKTEKGAANGRSRTNGGDADGERRTKARAAKAPAPGHDSTPPKPKRAGGGRGARAR